MIYIKFHLHKVLNSLPRNTESKQKVNKYIYTNINSDKTSTLSHFFDFTAR